MKWTSLTFFVLFLPLTTLAANETGKYVPQSQALRAVLPDMSHIVANGDTIDLRSVEWDSCGALLGNAPVSGTPTVLPHKVPDGYEILPLSFRTNSGAIRHLKPGDRCT